MFFLKKQSAAPAIRRGCNSSPAKSRLCARSIHVRAYVHIDCRYNTSLTLSLICMCMHLHHVHIDNYCSHTCTRICSYTPHMYVRAYTRTHFCSRTHTYTHVQRTLTYKHVHTLAYIPAKNRLCGGPAPQSGTCTV